MPSEVEGPRGGNGEYLKPQAREMTAQGKEQCEQQVTGYYISRCADPRIPLLSYVSFHSANFDHTKFGHLTPVVHSEN